MTFFSFRNTFWYGLLACLLGTSAHGMTTLETKNVNNQQTTQDTWSNALGTAVRTTLLFAPTCIYTYNHAQKLSVTQQQKVIGDQPVHPDLEKQIRAYMADQQISDADSIKIFSMRDALYRMQDNSSELPTPSIEEVQSTFKDNALGIYVTNKAIFIDENIINFEKKALLSEFLVTYALRNFKNNTYRNTIYAKIGLGILKTAALYKTIPLITKGAQKLTNAIGFTSFNDPQKGGFLLGVARFAINDVICQMIAQSIVQKISAQAFSIYKKTKKIELDETVVASKNVMPLIVEFSKIIVVNLEQGNNANTIQKSHAIFAEKYIEKLCLLADRLFFTKSIVAWFDNEITHHTNRIMKEFLEHLKNTFAQNPNGVD